MDTLIYDNFIYEQSLDKTVPDSDTVVFKQKNITPTFDQTRGSSEYTSGKAILDFQGSGNGDDRQAPAEAYITIPIVDTVWVKADKATTFSQIPVNQMTCPKNNALIESVRVEQGGNTIVGESQNSAHIINFVKHCTTSVDNLEKSAATTGYYPDSVGAYSATADLHGVINTVNNPNSTNLTSSEQYNEGLVKRQQFTAPYNTVSNALTTATNQLNEQAAYQEAIANASIVVDGVTTTIPADPTTCSVTTSYKVISRIHRLALIKQSELDDFWAKHPLTHGLGYKETLTLNQGSCEMAFATGGTPLSNKPTLSKTTLIGPATCLPIMACVGPNTLAAAITSSDNTAAVTLKVESKVDVSALQRQQGIILHMPSYVLTDESESKMMALQKVHRTPFKVTSNVFTGLTSNAPIGLQLFSAVSNPRLLVICPQLSQDTQTQASQASPLNPCPATTDPALSLTKIQVRVNSKTVLPSTVNYGWQQFVENTSRVLSLNGGAGPIGSGVIDWFKFKHNYRYYAFDLSSLPDSQRDVAQLISFEAFNNSAVKIDLYVFCLSEQSATFDMVKGGVEIQ